MLPLYNWTMRSKIYKWYNRLDKLNRNSDTTVDNVIKELISLQSKIQEQAKVPLSYRGEYYNLLLHIDLVLRNTKNKIKSGEKNGKSI